MSIWQERSERRRWRAELKEIPLHQLRANVQGGMFYQTPGKQRWARQWLWRREHIWGNPIALAGLGVTIVVPIVGLIGKLCGLL
jgi:hypothetical protein